MDTKNLQVPKPSTSESQISRYTFKRPFRQSFSLPYPIIKYMIQNPQSGKVWKKLIFSCKYFYSKYPVLPVKNLEVRGLKCKADGEIFNSSKPSPKLWVNDSFSALTDSSISPLITKIFKFDLRFLCIDCQSLTFHDYQKLTSSGSVEKLHFFDCEIKNAEGTIFTADMLIANLLHLEQFTLDTFDCASMFQTDTVKKMVHYFHGFKKMQKLCLSVFAEDFDFASFANFLLKNEIVNVNLYFYGHVSAAYKEMIENVMKEIKKNSLLKVPDIFL